MALADVDRPHETRDPDVDFVRDWSTKTEIPADRFIGWIGIARGSFSTGARAMGKANGSDPGWPMKPPICTRQSPNRR